MYKVIFVDFDDCLVLHINPKMNKFFEKSERAKYMFKPLSEAVRMYDQSCINEDVINYIKNAKDDNTKIIVLSEATSKLMELKQYYLEQYYPDLFDDYISVSSSDVPKALVISAYIQQYDIPSNKVLYIEDRIEDISQVKKEQLDIDILTPQIISYTTHMKPLKNAGLEN